MVLQVQPAGEHPGGIQEGIPVHDAVADKLGVFQAGNHRKDPLLLPPLEVGLEAHNVVQRPLPVFGPELDIGPGAVAGAGIGETHRPQRAIPHGIRSPGSHDLDGHAALVDGDGVGLFAHRVGVGGRLGVLVKVVEGRPLGPHQGGMEGLVFRLVEGAVEVVGLAPAIPGRREHLVVVQALGGDNGGHRVVEVEAAVPGKPGDFLGQGPFGEGAGGHQHRLALIDGGNLLPPDGDMGVFLHQPGDRGAEGVPVHRQGAAGRHPHRFSHRQQAAAHPAHFLFQQAGGRVQPVGLEAVGADQLGKTGALVGRGKVGRFLFPEGDLHPLAGQPEGRLASREACPQNGCMQCVVHVFLIRFHSLWAPASQSRSPLLHSTAWSRGGTGWRRTSRTWWAPAHPRS